MNPDTQRGMEFMRVVVKSALFALFAIGVRSTENIEKFVAAFEKALDRGLASSGFTPVEVKEPVNLKLVIKNNIMRSVLNKHGIHTVDDLMSEMGKRDLTELSGIGKKSIESIQKALHLWQSSR